MATGFHRNTLTNREGGVDQEQFRVEAVVDRVNTTARVLLGLTLGCASATITSTIRSRSASITGSSPSSTATGKSTSAAPLHGQAATAGQRRSAQTMAPDAGPADRRDETHVLIRGDFLRKGVEVHARYAGGAADVALSRSGGEAGQPARSGALDRRGATIR